MRCVARVLALAAVLAVAGCSLFRDSDVQVATITSVVAPDTVHVNSYFQTTVTACLGPNSDYVLERFDASISGAELTVQAWSRYRPAVAREFPDIPAYQDQGVGASPIGPGKFLIIAIQPDRRDTLTTITVLP